MIFEDPIRTITIELPAGWTYNLFESMLTDFYFTRWDRPSEVVGVHVRPASAAQDQPDENWIQQVQTHLGDKAVLTPVGSIAGCAVTADFGSESGPMQRVAFIRGPKVELVVEQRSMEPQANRWAPLEMALQTVLSTVNFATFKGSGVDEFNQFMESANEAFAKQDFATVVTSLRQAIEIGTGAWLYSLAPPVNSPDFNAAVRVAQAMVNVSSLTQDPLMQRNGEAILRRALCTLERMPGSSDETQKMKLDLSQTLDLMVSEMLEGTEEKASGIISPVIAMRERAFRATKFAEGAFGGLDFENAHSLSGLAVEDLLLLLSMLRRSQPQPENIPEELASHLADQGITDPAAQSETLQKARESLLFPPLVRSLQLRFSCSLHLGNFDFSEAADTLIPLAQLLHRNNPDDPGIALCLALAWLFCAEAALLQSGDQAAQDGEQCLGNAIRVFESISDAHGADMGWIQYHDRHFEGMIHALRRRLALFEEQEDIGESKRMESICSRFEKLSEGFREKAGEGRRI
jgi:hypothetical protein